MKERAKDIADITSTYILEEYEKSAVNGVQESIVIEKIIEHQGGSVLNPSEEFIVKEYGMDCEANNNLDNIF